MKTLKEYAQLVNARKEGCAVIYSINQHIWPRVRDLLDVLCDAAKKKEENRNG